MIKDERGLPENDQETGAGGQSEAFLPAIEKSSQIQKIDKTPAPSLIGQLHVCSFFRAEGCNVLR